jgi:hypothetical protein
MCNVCYTNTLGSVPANDSQWVHLTTEADPFLLVLHRCSVQNFICVICELRWSFSHSSEFQMIGLVPPFHSIPFHSIPTDGKTSHCSKTGS